MTREQIEAHVGRLESIAVTNWASPLDREAVNFAVARLRADLDAMPVGETKRVWIGVTSDDTAHVYNSPESCEANAGGFRIAVVVADIPVRQVPVVNGKVSK